MNSEIQLVGDSASTRFELTGAQDVRVASDLHRSLIELLTSNQPATVDCSRVDSFDAAAIQLLLAAKRETGDKFTIIAPNDSQSESWIALSGLKGRLLPTSAEG